MTNEEELWQTPNVPNGGRVNPPEMSDTGIMPDGSKRQVGLEDQVRRLERSTHSFLPAQPSESSGQPSSESAPTSPRRSARRQWASSLSGESLQKLGLLLSGRVEDETERNSLAYLLCYELAANSTRKRLNPSFVAHLMGAPEGLISPEPINSEDLATWSYQCRELLRSLCS